MSIDRPIMSVQEIIETAFGDKDTNVINFKLIEIVLTIISKQLNILDRRVAVQDSGSGEKYRTRLSVSEVKIHAAVPKNSKKKPGIVDKTAQISSSSTSKRSPSSKSSTSGTTLASVRSSSVSSQHVGDPKITKKTKADDVESIEELKGISSGNEALQSNRADSREEGVMTPSPMASMTNMEMEHEKLLVVERLTPEEAEKVLKTGKPHNRKLTIVTQDELIKVAKAVADLQSLFSKYESQAPPGKAKIMEDLHRQSSSTEAISVVQISARLECAEKAIKSMTEMLIELSKRPPPRRTGDENSLEDLMKQIERVVKPPMTESDKTRRDKRVGASQRDDDFGESSEEYVFTGTKTATGAVSWEHFNYCLKKLEDDIRESHGGLMQRANLNATNAMMVAKKAEARIERALTLEAEIRNLQGTMKHHAEQLNSLDAGLSSQLANYQEQLTQMQYDIETGMDNMQDALAVRGSDVEAMSELHAQFTALHEEFDNTKSIQQELEDVQTEMSLDISKLRSDVEILRDTKSDRDEVVDALRDKAGLNDLNGMVDRQYFDAVVGDLEKRIRDFYQKTFGQEVVWQKVIDDLWNKLRNKADWIHLVALRDDINKHLQVLKQRIHCIADILGEPNAAAVSRRLQRDSACLACATPAIMKIEEPNTVPAMPALRSKGISAEMMEPKPGGGGDEICYCGQPIPHQRKDSRSEVCNRYCGGEHTKAPFGSARVPPEVHVEAIPRNFEIAVGSDGKSYYVDQKKIMTPCVPCNKAKPSMRSSILKEPKCGAEASRKAATPSRISDTASIHSTWTSMASIDKEIKQLCSLRPTDAPRSDQDSVILESYIRVESLGTNQSMTTAALDVHPNLKILSTADAEAIVPIDIGISLNDDNQPVKDEGSCKDQLIKSKIHTFDDQLTLKDVKGIVPVSSGDDQQVTKTLHVDLGGDDPQAMEDVVAIEHEE